MEEDLSKKPFFSLELQLIAKFKGVILAGRPDSILFENGFQLIIFEYKFSRTKNDYLSYHVQAKTYGILLKNTGFNVGKLLYAIVVADRRTKNDEKLNERVFHAILNNGLNEATLKSENAAIYLNKFNPEEAELSLDWSIKFWKNQREPIGTTNPNKCRTIEYNKECKLSIFEDSHNFFFFDNLLKSECSAIGSQRSARAFCPFHMFVRILSIPYVRTDFVHSICSYVRSYAYVLH